MGPLVPTFIDFFFVVFTAQRAILLGPSLPTSLLIIGAVGGGGQLIGMAGYEGCFLFLAGNAFQLFALLSFAGDVFISLII